MVTNPVVAVEVRAYNVGFGDCLLVLFEYASGPKRAVLIDFGSTGRSSKSPEKAMEKIATEIQKIVQEQCGGVLHGLVATHRHKDHIGGFIGTAGQIIEALQPKVVTQPWTEHPDAAKDAKAAPSEEPKSIRAMRGNYLRSLEQMRGFCVAALGQANNRVGVVNASKIRFLADTNLPNKEAVDRLQRMAKAGKGEFVRAGAKSKLEGQLPGVKVHVLGPPDLTQTDSILKQKSSDKDEFWQFLEFWSLLQAGSNAVPAPVFAKAKTVRPPRTAQWFVNRANRQYGNQLLSIVRILDKALNNTSVILLFEVGGKKLLFSGDAQLENWMYALSQPEYRELVQGVDLYKVGHHGSGNATPKSLWKLIHQGPDGEGKLKTVLSTMKGKHHEVPQPLLMDALQAETELTNTEGVRSPALSAPVVRIQI
ncbi:hypothetical protein F183_A14740 [Bryobacterales bacterium F-183]|nr:hypothetical protein F183_A14740 [Bryobacterales bacterium F-183]